MRKIICRYGVAVFFCLLALVPAARADLLNPALKFSSATVTASSAQFLAADNSRRMLMIQNVCSVDVGITTSATAVLGSGGTLTLGPGDTVTFTGQDVPKNAWNGISESGSCDLTIGGLK